LRSARFDVEALLDGLAAVPDGSGDLEGLWIEHAADVHDVLGRALAAGLEPRRRALDDLDGRGAGLALGPLTEAGLSPAGVLAVQAIGDRLRDRVAALLDDPDPLVRRLAVRVASKLRDPRLGLSHVQAMVLGGGPESQDAAVLAARALLESGRLAGPTLVEALRGPAADRSWERRLGAVRVMRLAGTAARPSLARALADPSPFVRAEAAEALR
jgi:hypothetical protein